MDASEFRKGVTLSVRCRCLVCVKCFLFFRFVGYVAKSTTLFLRGEQSLCWLILTLCCTVHLHPAYRPTSFTVIITSAPKDKAPFQNGCIPFLLHIQSLLFWLHVQGKCTAVPIHSVKSPWDSPHLPPKGDFCLQYYIWRKRSPAHMMKHPVSSTHEYSEYKCASIVS